MSQNDMSIANADGATFRGDLNAALQALASSSGGTTAPSTTYPFQPWADTSTGLLKIRDAANTSWITIGTLASARLGLDIGFTVSPQTSDFVASSTDNVLHTITTAGSPASCDATLIAAPGGGFRAGFKNLNSYRGAPARIKRAGSDTIDGLAQLVLRPYEDIWLVSPSSGLWSIERARRLEELAVAMSDESTAITTGTAKVTFRLLRSFLLVDALATLSTESSSGAPQVDVNAAGVSVFGANKLTIDANERTSATAATPVTLTTQLLPADSEITLDIDAAGTGAKGLKLYLQGFWV